MDGFPTQETLTILPLGSYDFLIGMDWLDAYKTKLECHQPILTRYLLGASNSFPWVCS
jgi:hypothetical protein